MDSWVRHVWFSCEHPRKVCNTYSFQCDLGLRPTWKDSPGYFEWKDDWSGFVPFETDWDDCIPDDVSSSGCRPRCVWMICDPRCYVPEDFRELFSTELHYFADSCEFGHGRFYWLGFTNQFGQVYCTFAFGKSCVAQLKQMTFHWRELVPGVLAASFSVQIRNKLFFILDSSLYSQTGPLCWVTWWITRSSLTFLLRTGWLWFDKIHNFLVGIMWHLILSQHTMLPEVWIERPFFDVTSGRMGRGRVTSAAGLLWCWWHRSWGQGDHMCISSKENMWHHSKIFVIFLRLASFLEIYGISEVDSAGFASFKNTVLFTWMGSENPIYVRKSLKMRDWLWFSGFSN